MPEPTLPAESVRGRGVILQGDARSLMLPDASVDLVVTSPPYFGLRDYAIDQSVEIGSEQTPELYISALLTATAEMARVLKPNGSVFVNLGDKYAGAGRHAPEPGGVPTKSLLGLPWRYANAVVDQLGLLLRRDLIWHKSNGLPESVTDRCRSAHEYWFHFTKQGRYFAAIDEIREPHLFPNQKRTAGKRDWQPVPDNTAMARPDHPFFTNNPLGKLPSSVWTVPSEPLRIPAEVAANRRLPDHYAAFPSAWPVRLIAGWAPSNGVVLDPFGGSGTVAMVAREMGRIGISVDCSLEYCRLAQWRVCESDGGAKALAKARKNGLLRPTVSQKALDLGGAA